jgi:hypothetical protein
MAIEKGIQIDDVALYAFLMRLPVRMVSEMTG